LFQLKIDSFPPIIFFESGDGRGSSEATGLPGGFEVEFEFTFRGAARYSLLAVALFRPSGSASGIGHYKFVYMAVGTGPRVYYEVDDMSSAMDERGVIPVLLDCTPSKRSLETGGWIVSHLVYGKEITPVTMPPALAPPANSPLPLYGDDRFLALGSSVFGTVKFDLKALALQGALGALNELIAAVKEANMGSASSGASGAAGAERPHGDLPRLLRNWGLELELVAGDNNCLFSGLALQLSRILRFDGGAKEMRAVLVAWMSDNGDLVIDDGGPGSQLALLSDFNTAGSWDGYLLQMSQHDATWGDHCVLVAAACFFNVRIHVFYSIGRPEGPVTVRAPSTYLSGAFPDTADIALAFSPEIHYDSTMPLSTVALGAPPTHADHARPRAAATSTELTAEEAARKKALAELATGEELALARQRLDDKIASFRKGHQGRLNKWMTAKRNYIINKMLRDLSGGLLWSEEDERIIFVVPDNRPANATQGGMSTADFKNMERWSNAHGKNRSATSGELSAVERVSLLEW